jgi:hypothetical protein
MINRPSPLERVAVMAFWNYSTPDGYLEVPEIQRFSTVVTVENNASACIYPY